jgi:mannose-6-phosphate isomerase-like protein (cupin superfamily)
MNYISPIIEKIKQYFGFANTFASLEKERRPWGWYSVLLDTPECKVKIITVNPNSRLSLQSHEYRQEHWYVIEGELTVEKGWDSHILLQETLGALSSKKYTDIETKQIHRASNKTNKPARFIEVQTGSYFGEDDIKRYQDDYGRG